MVHGFGIEIFYLFFALINVCTSFAVVMDIVFSRGFFINLSQQLNGRRKKRTSISYVVRYVQRATKFATCGVAVALLLLQEN